MSDLCRFLAVHGPTLLLGATCLLALGCIGTAMHRAPVHRQRAGELAMLGVIVWLALAVVPLPRLSLSGYVPVTLPEAASGSASGVGLGGREQSEVASPLPVARATANESAPQGLYPETSKTPEVLETSGVYDEAGSIPAPASPTPTQLASGGWWLSVAKPQWRAAGARSALPQPPNVPQTTVFPEAAGLGPSAAQTSPVDWAYVLPGAYVAGSLGCLLWLALGRVLLLRLELAASAPAAWLEDLHAETTAGERRKPRLLVSGRTARAFSVGLWRPTIVLPEAVCQPQRREVLRHLLSHELAHVRRRDCRGWFWLNLAFPLLYFHPLYWLLRGAVAMAAEEIADDEAARATTKVAYVDALVALARERRPRGALALGCHGLFGSPSQFYRRMKMLLNRKTRLAPCCSWPWRLVSIAVCVLMVGALAATVGVRPAAAQTAVPSPTLTTGPTERVVQATEEKAVVDALRKERDELKKLVGRLEADLKALQQKAHDDLMGQKGDVAPSRATTRPGAMSPPTVPITVAPGFTGPRRASGTPGLYPPATVVTPGAAAPPTAPTGPGPNDLPPGARPGGTPPTVHHAPPAGGASTRLIPEVRHAIETLPDGTTREAMVPYLKPIALAQTEVGAVRGPANGSQLDLVSLANSYADAVASLKIASLQHARLEQLSKAAAVSEEELEIAAARFEAAKRKVDLLRGIAQSALKTTEAEVRVLLEWHKAGQQVAGVGPIELQLPRAEGRLEILRTILQQ